MGRFARAARTPLFRSVVRALRIASHSVQSGRPPAEIVGEQLSRRTMLKAAGAGALTFAASPLLSACAPIVRGPDAPRVAIVGAGVAGLNAAYTLKKAGLRAELFDANRRSGGRMFTARDVLGPGLTVELGGEFIDTSHEDILALAQEFGLELIDTRTPAESHLIAEAYFFEGRHYSADDVIEAFIPLIPRLKADADSIGDTVNFENDGGAKALDAMTFAQYLDRIGASGWLRKLLEVAYVTEFGLDAGEQSALNFLDMIPTEAPDEGPLELLGDSDERYKILGGNQKIVDELARRLDGQIRLEHRLTRIASAGNGYVLSFDVAGGKPLEVRADIVIIAIPFTLLREVDIRVALPPVKMKAIRELGYGMCAKVMAGFDARPWRDQGFAGNIFSDEPFQLAWENSRLQPAAGPQAGITFYSGGAAALRAVSGTPEEQALRFMRSLEKAYPGSWKHFNGKTARMDWPNYAWTKAAYACYRPGQWTTISGAEFMAVGNLHFAGEHCSPEFLGFMSGGAETGRRAAEAILAGVGALRKVA